MWKKEVRESVPESYDLTKTRLAIAGFEIEEKDMSQGMCRQSLETGLSPKASIRHSSAYILFRLLTSGNSTFVLL